MPTMAELVVLFLLVAPLFVLMAVARKQREIKALRAATVELHVDATGLHRELADGRVEGVRWAEVNEVEVLTAKQGVHGAHGGVVIVGDGCDKGCLVPLDQIAEVGLVEHLTRLPGFDVKRFVAALEMRPPKRTVCWTRVSPPGDGMA
jgi:hypothetical protein